MKAFTTALLPMTTIAAASILFACRESTAATTDRPAVERAVAVLVPVGESGVSGEVQFERIVDGLRITGRIEGLAPGDHGFHVHQYGDLSDRSSGASAGGHFAPEGSPHGKPSDEQRHVGDLGNVVAGKDGTATIDLVDHVVALSGERSIVGRALVVHAGADHFTQPSGNAGERVAFGVIGIAKPTASR